MTFQHCRIRGPPQIGIEASVRRLLGESGLDALERSRASRLTGFAPLGGVPVRLAPAACGWQTTPHGRRNAGNASPIGVVGPESGLSPRAS
jgi:hypothetical protein